MGQPPSRAHRLVRRGARLLGEAKRPQGGRRGVSIAYGCVVAAIQEHMGAVRVRPIQRQSGFKVRPARGQFREMNECRPCSMMRLQEKGSISTLPSDLEQPV